MYSREICHLIEAGNYLQPIVFTQRAMTPIGNAMFFITSGENINAFLPPELQFLFLILCVENMDG